MLTTDPAFQEHVSGLLVPREVARERQVFTSQERKLLDRAQKLLHSKGLWHIFECQHPDCEHVRLERIENPDGGFTLRCRSHDRIFRKGA